MVRLTRRIKALKTWKGRYDSAVHDELKLQVYKDEFDKIKQIVLEEMET